MAVVCCRLLERSVPDWDPDDVAWLHERFERRAREVVVRFAGRIETQEDVTILAAFEDPDAAVRAALALVDEATALRWPDGGPARASAVVGDDPDLSGPEDRRPPDESRSDPLAALDAPPGAVWVAGPVHDVTRDGIRYRCVVRQPAEEAGETTRVWRATGIGPVAAGAGRAVEGAAQVTPAAGPPLEVAPAPEVPELHGLSRCRAGDPGGRDDIERDLLASDADDDARAALERDYARALYWTEGPAAAVQRLAAMDGELSGDRDHLRMQLSLDRATCQAALGEWDAAIQDLEELDAELHAAEGQDVLLQARSLCAVLLARQGRTEDASRLAEVLVEMAHGVASETERSWGLLGGAVVAGLGGEAAVADELVTEWVHGWSGNDAGHVDLLPDAVRLATGCSDPRWRGEPLGAVLSSLPIYGLVLDAVAAVRLERRGETRRALEVYSGLAESWRSFGVPYEQAHALLGRARCLGEFGNAPEALQALESARRLFAGLGAHAPLAEGDVLRARLQGTIALS